MTRNATQEKRWNTDRVDVLIGPGSTNKLEDIHEDVDDIEIESEGLNDQNCKSLYFLFIFTCKNIFFRRDAELVVSTQHHLKLEKVL